MQHKSQKLNSMNIKKHQEDAHAEFKAESVWGEHVVYCSVADVLGSPAFRQSDTGGTMVPTSHVHAQRARHQGAELW